MECATLGEFLSRATIGDFTLIGVKPDGFFERISKEILVRVTKKMFVGCREKI